MLVAEVSDFCFIKPVNPMVTLPAISDLVLPHVVQYAETGQKQHYDLSTKIDAMTDRVSGCIADEVSPPISC